MFKIYDQKRIINYLFSRYGVSKDYFENYLFLYKNKSIFIISKDKKDAVKKIITNKSVVSLGIELFSDIKHFTPCSLGFCVINKNEIKQNYVVFKRQQVVDYLNGKNISINNISNKNILSNGYIICIYENKIIGTCTYENKILIPNLAFINTKAK
jgi:hypothetical protein